MKKYNRENCQSVVRATITDALGRTITLIGQHAFEWSIVMESCGKITITTYPNGKLAKKDFNQIKKRK